MEIFEVLSPAGSEIIKRKSIAPRLDNFDGKTVGEVWNGVYKGNDSFPALREQLKQRYPGLKVIPYTEFPFRYGGDTLTQQKEFARHIAALAKEKGCDALISGNGA
ncbi:MAG TPA: hypothetical protein VGQ54_08450 [Burkholderiales bacterium]|jgi:hypothetical protein|nr:hypothetical protein [Burkholderiales bacterium]